MEKLAIFVEGQTELLLIRKLFSEIAGSKNIEIQNQYLTSNSGFGRSIQEIEANSSVTNVRYFVMIVNCEADNRVASAIKENHKRLSERGYKYIIGLRDVYPTVIYNDIQKLRDGLSFGMPTSPIEVLFVLGVMEIETWFISECSHFQKIDPKLKGNVILNGIGFDPCTENVQLRPNPADDLNKIYNLVQKAYTKKEKNALRTIEALDYANIYLNLSLRIPDLKNLMDCFNRFLN